MITINDINNFNNSIEFYGLATDQKPVNYFTFYGIKYTIKNASTFYCMDSKDTFIYDEENNRWLEV